MKAEERLVECENVNRTVLYGNCGCGTCVNREEAHQAIALLRKVSQHRLCRLGDEDGLEINRELELEIQRCLEGGDEG